MAKQILILTALKLELEPFIQGLDAIVDEDAKKGNYYHASYGSLKLALIHLGVGKNFLKKLKKIDISQFDSIILAGMAGGLKSEHKIGTIVFPENIMTIENNELGTVYHPSEQLIYRIRKHLPSGNLLCVDKIITKKEKALLEESIDFVDMESYRLANHFKSQEIPFLVIKAVSDNLATKMPKLELIKKGFKEITLKLFLISLLLRPLDLIWLFMFYKNMKKSSISSYKYVLKVLDELY